VPASRLSREIGRGGEGYIAINGVVDVDIVCADGECWHRKLKERTKRMKK
jgi:hypothetical protein